MCSLLQKPCVGAFLSCARYWCSAGSGDLGKAGFVITYCIADERLAGSMARAKLFLGQDHSRPDGTCSG